MGSVVLMGATQAHPDAAATALAGDRTTARVMHPRAAATPGMPEREALLEAAETALARGLVSTAILGFDQAATMLHASDTEMGLVRAWMQEGEYRRALAFAAHTAGAHLDSPAAGALYAWLLRIGGQGAVASRVLAQTHERAPADPVVAATLRAFEAQSPVASGALLDVPQRMAPQAVILGVPAPLPSGVRQISSGVLLGDGQRALVPVEAIRGAQRIWVRNGLGQTAVALVETVPDALAVPGFALVRLSSRLDAGNLALASRDPFPGSPGASVAYATAADSEAAWPWLVQGFFGAFSGSDGMRKLGIAAPPAHSGGPVFDAAGRLAGISVRDTEGHNLMVPASLFRGIVESGAQTSAPQTADGSRPATRIGIDQVYEQGLKVALQVLTLQ